MKKSAGRIICFFMCLVLIASMFAACNNKGDDTTTTDPNGIVTDFGESTTVLVNAQDDEVMNIIVDAFGEDFAQNFNGDLNSLSEVELQKFKDTAQSNGYVVDESGSGVVVQKPTAETTVPTTAYITDKQIKNAIESALGAKAKDWNGDMSALSATEKADLEQALNKLGVSSERLAAFWASAYPESSDTKLPSVTTTTRVRPTAQSTTRRTTITYPNLTTATTKRSSTTLKVTATATEWLKGAGGSSNDLYNASAATEDGGYVAIGATYSTDGTFASKIDSSWETSIATIVKYDSDGDIKWMNALGGDGQVSFEDVAVLEDGRIVAVGYTFATNVAEAAEYKMPGTVEALVAVYTARGKLEKVKIIGGSDSEMAYSVCATADGGYIVGGKSLSADGDFKGNDYKVKAFLFKYNSDNAIVWKEILSGSKHCSFNDISVDKNGFIYTTCATVCVDGDFAQYEGLVNGRKANIILKYKADGTMVWGTPIYGNGTTIYDRLCASDDGGCVIVGHYAASKMGNGGVFADTHNIGDIGTYDSVIFKLDSKGEIEWDLPMRGYYNDYLCDIAKVNNGYAIVGYTASSNRDFDNMVNKGGFDSYIVVINKLGIEQRKVQLGGSDADIIKSVSTNGEDEIFVCGYTRSPDGYFAKCTPVASENAATAFASKFTVTFG